MLIESVFGYGLHNCISIFMFLWWIWIRIHILGRCLNFHPYPDAFINENGSRWILFDPLLLLGQVQENLVQKKVLFPLPFLCSEPWTSTSLSRVEQAFYSNCSRNFGSIYKPWMLYLVHYCNQILVLTMFSWISSWN